MCVVVWNNGRIIVEGVYFVRSCYVKINAESGSRLFNNALFLVNKILMVAISVHNLIPRVLSLPPSRKYPGGGWSRFYGYKSNPHRGWVFDLIVSTLSMEVKVALQTLFWKSSKLFVREFGYIN